MLEIIFLNKSDSYFLIEKKHYDKYINDKI